MTANPHVPTTIDRRDGRYQNPWGQNAQGSLGAFLRWVVIERLSKRLHGRRRQLGRRAWPRAFPAAEPAFPTPRAHPDALCLTWIGHSSFLIQIGATNLLVDPIWSARASPVPWLGPRRWAEPGVPFGALPPIDAVLISHDHYDHLDDPTVRRLNATDRPPAWIVPSGVGDWVRAHGARDVTELDWWGQHRLSVATPQTPAQSDGSRDSSRTLGGTLEITATPAQHFSGRRVNNRNETLWCGWVVRLAHRAVWFVGDTGRHPAFAEIGRRLGPFDAVLMPIGAYDPQWFMRPVHLNPEDAVSAFLEATTARPSPGVPAVMVAMHWGTFRLTDEPMEEPPERAMRAWETSQLPAGRLWIPRYGETRVL